MILTPPPLIVVNIDMIWKGIVKTRDAIVITIPTKIIATNKLPQFLNPNIVDAFIDSQIVFFEK